MGHDRALSLPAGPAPLAISWPGKRLYPSRMPEDRLHKLEMGMTMESLQSAVYRSTPVTNESATIEIANAFSALLARKRCLVCTGPSHALFRTPMAGGEGLANYVYRTFTQGGFKEEGDTSGEGFSDWDECRTTFLSLLGQHLKDEFPVVVRTWPEANMNPETGRWFIYSRFVQLDFKANAMLVEWDLRDNGRRP